MISVSEATPRVTTITRSKQPAERKQYVKFAPKGTPSFYDTVKDEVSAYFSENNIPEHGNRKMYIKTAAMISMFIVPFVVLCTGVVSAYPVLFYMMWSIMGLGVVGIGTSVMHDSNHGSYSSNKKLNNAMGYIINLIGGYSLNWKIQHNVLHHTYTNISGLDEDIDTAGLVRMSPNDPHHKIHRWQHIYAWPVYAIMNLHWAITKDFLALRRYEKLGLLQKQRTTYSKALTKLILLRLAYFSVFVGLPIILNVAPWTSVVLGWVLMQVISGFALALIFQPAHVLEDSSFAVPIEGGKKMEDSWAVHQIKNTTNFCHNSVITSWFIGGLNYQIEHHLFPHICHVHYPQISAIVRRVANDFGIPYNSEPTFLHAIVSHGRFLKKLSRP